VRARERERERDRCTSLTALRIWQTDAYARLSTLEAQWYDLTRKNAEIELACAALEVQLAQTRPAPPAAAVAGGEGAGAAAAASQPSSDAMAADDDAE
jgi:hypothetical protein